MYIILTRLEHHPKDQWQINAITFLELDKAIKYCGENMADMEWQIKHINSDFGTGVFPYNFPSSKE